MTRKNSSKLKLTFCLLAALIIMLLPAKTVLASQANFPLEITNIKPAGTGEPPIPETNRIFRAYPGIEYNIRAAVIGGVYPYHHELSNAPSGMTIDSFTGEISWPDPQTSTGEITLSVTDSEGTTVSTSWSITVETDGFHFVDGSYSGTETGSKEQPYSSLENFLTNTLGTPTTAIVYIRAGTYDMVDHNSSHDHIMRIDNNPANWLAYPGESVVLQGGDNPGQGYRINAAGESVYFDGLTIKDVVAYGITLFGRPDYFTIRRCIFDGLIPPDSTNNNYGFLHTSADGLSYFSVIQDNEFKNWYGASAIGSLYDDKKLLIENNYIHSPNPHPSGEPGGIGRTLGIAPKSSINKLTVRGNKVVMEYGTPIAHHNSLFTRCYDTEICYNLFYQPDNFGTDLHTWNYSSTQKGPLYYYRNTAIGGRMYYRTPMHSDTEPWHYDNSIFITDENEVKNHAMTVWGDNLESDVATNDIVDLETFKLTAAYEQYVGVHGWQLEDGSTPIDSSLSPPRSLRIAMTASSSSPCSSKSVKIWNQQESSNLPTRHPQTPVIGAKALISRK